MVCKVKLNRLEHKNLCCQHLNNSFLGFLWQHNFYISLQSVCIKKKNSQMVKFHNSIISKTTTTVLCLFTVKYDIQINKRSTVKLKYEG